MNRAGNDDGPRGTAIVTHAFLERLPQDLEGMPAELRHLVEEQDAVMGQADLAGPRDGAAADERDIGDRMMRRAERALGQQARARWQQSATECTVVTSSASSKVSGGRIPASRRAIIVLPAPGGPISRSVVAARGRDLERAPRERLTVDVGEVRPQRGSPGAAVHRDVAVERPLGFVQRDRFGQRRTRVQLEPVDDRGLALVRRGSSNPR